MRTLGRLLALPAALALMVGCNPYGQVRHTTPEPPALNASSTPSSVANTMPSEAEPAAPTAATTGIEAQRNAVKAMVTALNAHDVKRWSAQYATDAVLTVIPGMGDIRGRDAVANDQGAFLQAFTDLKVGANRMWQSGDVAVVEWITNATHLGDYMGLKATKKQTGQVALSVLTFNAEGLIKSEHLYYDGGTLLAQITGKGVARAIPPVPTQTEYHVADGSADEAKGVEVGKRVFAKMEANKPLEFLALLDESYEFSATMAPLTEKGKASAKKAFEHFTTAFPDQKYEITKSIGVGDFAIFEYALNGTQSGPIGTLQATRAPVSWHWVQIFQTKDGKVARSWAYANMIELIAQLQKAKPAAPASPARRPSL